ncbi:MAG: peroxiredoxin [Pseudomonadota bacterium]
MLKAGDTAPSFSLPDQDGTVQTLEGLLSDGPLVLYFYPADFTPGCTKEACSIRDMHDDLMQARLRVVGVSPQDAASHTRFREKHRLTFTLLADENKTVIRQFKVDGPLGIGVRRATFLIGTDRRIQDAVQADVMISRHQDFLRKAVRAQRRP